MKFNKTGKKLEEEIEKQDYLNIQPKERQIKWIEINLSFFMSIIWLSFILISTTNYNNSRLSILLISLILEDLSS